MPNLLGLAGAQPQKPTRFAPIYTPRWSSGIWTNRSPLRDAATTRISEKYYGAAGDALIAGSNVEITNRLTLARRPGNSVFDSNSYNLVDRFYDFRLFGLNSEQIDVMIDQANALYSLYAGTKSLVWTKQTGAGQSYMQSVGNSLYWGDGVSNKKWLETLTVWSADAAWNTPNTPFLSTFFIDPNGNIEQLTGTVIHVSEVQVIGDVLTITSPNALTDVLSSGNQITFPAGMTASFLDGQTVTIITVSGDTFTADFTNPDYGPAAESGVIANEITGDSTPSSGGSEPTWSTVVPSSSNNFQGGITDDGTAQWTNRGNPVENWGILNTGKAMTPAIGSSRVAWQKNTNFSLAAVTIDTNGNLQQVVVRGLSGASAPAWATSVGDLTTDGSGSGAVIWKMIQTAASLNWAPNTAYTPSILLNLTSVDAAAGGSTVYNGIITGGASNAFAGSVFVVSKFANTVNNGTFNCTASTLTTLTLTNGLGVAETNSGTATTEGTYIVGNAYGTPCLFQLGPGMQPSLTGTVSAYQYDCSGSAAAGVCLPHGDPGIGALVGTVTTLNSLSLVGNAGPPSFGFGPIQWAIVNGAAQIVGTTVPFAQTQNFMLNAIFSLNVPVAGTYSFSITHHDGMIWGINGATLISGTSDDPYHQTLTYRNAYPVLGGTNQRYEDFDPVVPSYGMPTDTFVVGFPTAGVYLGELDFGYWRHNGLNMQVMCQGNALANGSPESGTVEPTWPAWTTIYAPNYPTVADANGQLTWINLGPISDYTWTALTNYTLPDTTIIDPNGFTEAPYRTGITGLTAPTFATGFNQLTLDNPNLIWINQGQAISPPSGTVSTFNGGWRYGIALVNTLDNTVSNMSPLSAATGNFVGADGITIKPGDGLPPVSQIDPQADYVAIFRTTDGESTPFLIPGPTPDYTIYTISLANYLVNGYVDDTPDTGLDNLIEGAEDGENTPPGAGAINLTYHLNRIFFSIGNVVYWTSGPDTPVGNGVNGVSPSNFDTFPSLVKRLVPTSSGLMVFTVSDVYLIQGAGTSTNPIQSGTPVFQGVGLLSYNALDVNGSIIGFFSTDKQFLIIDPSTGLSKAGFPIGDQFRKNTGNPGTTWNPANVYVAWHVDGEDEGWYVADGLYGWYKLIPTPAPEQGLTWSPYATIVGGCKAVQSIEVSPGLHELLLGPVTTGSILSRDLDNWLDNGESYPANATIGSAVLAQPGQVATVSFITTESVNTGTPLWISLLVDEALPYYAGPFETLRDWVTDPPGLAPSQSILAQRFYLDPLEYSNAVCRHMQIQVTWNQENALNEILSLTLYGGFQQEN